MTTSDQLIATLEQNPSDFPLYAITADALEDEGEFELSLVFRWCARHCKRPSFTSSNGWNLYYFLGESEGLTFPEKWVFEVDDRHGEYCKTLRERLATLIPFIHEMQ